jgi:hypothetical protein
LGWLQTLAAELVITASSAEVWVSIAQALLFGGVSLVFGVWVARKVGLLDAAAQTAETVAVGLASGLMVLAAWWATVASGGRSTFTPVAIGFAIAIGLAAVRRARRTDAGDLVKSTPTGTANRASASRSARAKPWLVGALGGATFIVAVALLYGSTMALRPRDGVQPLEFMDEAYYSILGADLATTGTESIYSPSGFTNLEGLPVQTWYHWGELWLAAAVIQIVGTDPLLARHFVVLPVVLLAAAAMTGTVVRRMCRTNARGAFLFGFFACLFLAPVPLIPGPFFSSWAVGLLFGITTYGLAAVAVVLALCAFAIVGSVRASWSFTAFVGVAFAFLLPAHIVVAVLAALGVGSVWAIRVLQSLLSERRLPQVAPIWRRIWAIAAVATASTVVWGLTTGHGIGTSGLSPNVSAFSASWFESVAITVLGGGAFFAIAVAWILARRHDSISASIYVGTAVLLVAGAIVWGGRLGDFTMFHVFYGGIAVFAAPVAAFALWSVWMRLRASGHVRLALVTLVACLLQIEIGFGTSIIRLQLFGPHSYAPVPETLLAAIKALPPDAKVAYNCAAFEEVAFWDPRLIALSAQTGRSVVPMCFQAEFFASLNGAPISADIESPLFRWAPQRNIYPSTAAPPAVEQVASFLEANRIDYIYADDVHPNSLVPGAVVIASSGDARLLRLP